MIVFETILAMLAIGVLILGLARGGTSPTPSSSPSRGSASLWRRSMSSSIWSPSWYWRSSWRPSSSTPPTTPRGAT